MKARYVPLILILSLIFVLAPIHECQAIGMIKTVETIGITSVTVQAPSATGNAVVGWQQKTGSWLESYRVTIKKTSTGDIVARNAYGPEISRAEFHHSIFESNTGYTVIVEVQAKQQQAKWMGAKETTFTTGMITTGS